MASTRGQATRERILDVALELFTQQGYDKTSLRDIAERLGVTKAALYYYFERKEDILLELHLRVHEIGEDAFAELDRLPDGPARAAAWPAVIDGLVDQLLARRPVMLLHLRNPTAVAALGDDPRHTAANEEIFERFRGLLGDPEIPLAARVRIMASIGAAMAVLVAGGEAFAGVPDAELSDLLRAAIADLLEP